MKPAIKKQLALARLNLADKQAALADLREKFKERQITLNRRIHELKLEITGILRDEQAPS